MEDESQAAVKSLKMGADNNTARLGALQSRKQALEEKIATKNKELRKLCIQEAELTGVMPAEIPLEPGEQVPTFRRRVGTAFEYPQNIIINSLNNEDETVPALETKIQVQRKIAEAALQLANSSTISKSIRRKNMSLYRQTKQQLEFMEERLEHLKLQNNGQTQQLKQKKKPRPLLEADTISTKSSNPSHNEDTISMISRSQKDISNIEADRFSQHATNKYGYKNSPYLLEGDIHNANVNYHLTEDGITPINRASVNSYINDRRSTEHAYIHSQSNPNLYQQQPPQQQQQPHMYISNTHTLPHMPPTGLSHPNINFPVHAHTLQYPITRGSRCIPGGVGGVVEEPPRKYEHYRNGGYIHEQPQAHHPYYSSHSLHHVPQMTSQHPYKYESVAAAAAAAAAAASSSTYNNTVNINNHHILAHQQYETDASSSAGLGGHWIKTEGGEMVWCPTLAHDDGGSTWQTDKRFGSLDRRKGKHIHHKRTSPNLDIPPVTTITTTPIKQQRPQPEQPAPRPLTLQPSTTSLRSRHDRQLVRTQSLGSVGTHTVDSVWPSDDNSSYDSSDTHSINDVSSASTRKLKQKGWCETSLDGPLLLPSSPPQHPQHSQQHPARITEEAPPLQSPRTPKPILEIPAESKPSPVVVETNLELFNNNVLSELPKNCTVVQAGQCKPYREVTKPFEMSDFYKYSTKFRQQDNCKVGKEVATTPEGQNTPNRDGDDGQEDVYQKGVYQPLQPMKCQPFTPPPPPPPTNNFNRSFTNIGSPDYANTSLDTSLALNQSTSNVAEHFSAEMNAWYHNHNHTHAHAHMHNHSQHSHIHNHNVHNVHTVHTQQTRIESNNTSTSPVSSMGRSTATLV